MGDDRRAARVDVDALHVRGEWPRTARAVSTVEVPASTPQMSG